MQAVLQEAEEACNTKLVGAVLLYTALAVGGLSRAQLLSLLALEERLADAGAERRGVEALLPLVEGRGGGPALGQLCLCLERLEALLARPGGRLAVAPGPAAAVVQERIVRPQLPARLQRAHRLLACAALARYRAGLADPPTLLALPAHLGAAGEPALLRQTLCSAAFLQAKVRAGLGSSLQADLEGTSLKLRSQRDAFAKDPLVAEYRAFLLASLPSLARAPAQLPQLLLNLPPDSRARASFLEQPWSGPVLLQLCSGPRSEEEAALASSLLREQPANPATCLAARRHLLVTGFQDGSVVAADRASRRDLYSLVGHSDAICGLGFLSDSVLVSGSQDGWICSWDLETGARLRSARWGGRHNTGIYVARGRH
jgi:hypothetical protein